MWPIPESRKQAVFHVSSDFHMIPSFAFANANANAVAAVESRYNDG